jgi:16S rRNA U516 pseudouridylate synthase RsuA-like enzyme
VRGTGRAGRQVRKLCARAGLVVKRLHRVAMGPLRLDALPEGAVRSLTEAEVAACYAATGLTMDGLPTPPVLRIPTLS